MTELTYKYFDKLNSLINEEGTNDMTTVSQEYKDSLQEKIDALQRELDSLKVKKEWHDTKDEIELKDGNDCLVVMCNKKSWVHVKDNSLSEEILFLDVHEGNYLSGDTACTALSFEEMIQLRDYLNQKIEYLQL